MSVSCHTTTTTTNTTTNNSKNQKSSLSLSISLRTFSATMRSTTARAHLFLSFAFTVETLTDFVSLGKVVKISLFCFYS